jgi:hypothetical protein
MLLDNRMLDGVRTVCDEFAAAGGGEVDPRAVRRRLADELGGRHDVLYPIADADLRCDLVVPSPVGAEEVWIECCFMPPGTDGAPPDPAAVLFAPAGSSLAVVTEKMPQLFESPTVKYLGFLLVCCYCDRQPFPAPVVVEFASRAGLDKFKWSLAKTEWEHAGQPGHFTRAYYWERKKRNYSTP